MADTVYKLQQRVDQYSTEAQVYTEGSDRINIEIPGISGVEETNKILEELGKPGSLYFIRQTDENGNQNYELGTDENGNYGYVLTKDLEQIIADGDAVLQGTDVAEAKAGYQSDNMNNQEIVVSLTFTDEGKQKFADATTKAYAAGESIGIYYDGRFISVPRVQARRQIYKRSQSSGGDHRRPRGHHRREHDRRSGESCFQHPYRWSEG